jgi:hypothetical protein
MSIAILAAAPSADLVVGLLLGAAIGFLAGPLVRSGLLVREWREASREARESRLTDELLFRIEEELTSTPDALELDEDAPTPDEGAATPDEDERQVPWRTSR